MYSNEILDRFDLAIGQVADAMTHMRENLGKPSEVAAKHDLDKARAAYDEVCAELDDRDA